MESLIINEQTYHDGEEIKAVKANYLICDFNYSIQFYGYKDDKPTFKHFLTVRMLWKVYSWTFRTREYAYFDNPVVRNIWEK